MLANITKRKLLCGQFAMENSSTSYNSVVFLGLLKEEPVDDENGQRYPTYEEITGTGYHRAFLSEYNEGSYTNRVLEWSIENGKVRVKNKDTIFIAECEEADWETATYFGIFNADGKSTSTRGELIAWGRIKNSEGEPEELTPQKGEIPVIRPNQLSISLE